MKSIQVVCIALICALVGFCGWLVVASINHHHSKHHTRVQTVHHLAAQDGHQRYAYQDNLGFWWYYMAMSNQPPTYVIVNGGGGGSSPSSATRAVVPSGGVWSKSAKAPEPEEEEGMEEAELSEQENGSPADTQAEAASGDIAAGEGAGSGAPVAVPAISEPAAPSEAAGGDTGGSAGGDSGGGGGSCGGGCGAD